MLAGGAGACRARRRRPAAPRPRQPPAAPPAPASAPAGPGRRPAGARPERRRPRPWTRCIAAWADRRRRAVASRGAVPRCGPGRLRAGRASSGAVRRACSSPRRTRCTARRSSASRARWTRSCSAVAGAAGARARWRQPRRPPARPERLSEEGVRAERLSKVLGRRDPALDVAADASRSGDRGVGTRVAPLRGTRTLHSDSDLACGMADLQQLFQLGQQMQGRLQQLQTELAEPDRRGQRRRRARARHGRRPGRGIRAVASTPRPSRGATPSCWPTWSWARSPRRSGGRPSWCRPRCGRCRPVRRARGSEPVRRHRGAGHRAGAPARHRPEDGAAAHLPPAAAATGAGRPAGRARWTPVAERVRPCAECGNLTEEERCEYLPRPPARRRPALRGRGAVGGARWSSAPPSSAGATTCSAGGSRRSTASGPRRSGSTQLVRRVRGGGGARGDPRDQSVHGGRGDGHLPPAGAGRPGGAGDPPGARPPDGWRPRVRRRRHAGARADWRGRRWRDERAPGRCWCGRAGRAWRWAGSWRSAGCDRHRADLFSPARCAGAPTPWPGWRGERSAEAARLLRDYLAWERDPGAPAPRAARCSGGSKRRSDRKRRVTGASSWSFREEDSRPDPVVLLRLPARLERADRAARRPHRPDGGHGRASRRPSTRPPSPRSPPPTSAPTTSWPG